MPSTTQTAPVPMWMLVLGWIVSVPLALMLLMSGVMKFVKPDGMEKQFSDLGWDMNLAPYLGTIEIACALIYLFPRTAVLGAILLTGYLGGAIATHVRVHESFVIQAILGVLVWAGLYLRDARLRALIPWRS